MPPSLNNTIYDWRTPSGHIRRIHLESERYPCLALTARIELADGRRKEIGTGSSEAAHQLVRELCEALKAGTASFEGVETEAQNPQWKPRRQVDGRVSLVYPKIGGFHSVIVEDCPDFRGNLRPGQCVYVANTAMARALAKAVAEGDLDITPAR